MTFKDMVLIVVNLLEKIVWLLMGLALLTFLYGLMRYMLGAAEESDRAESRQYIVYGIIGLFVMVSMWGLVGVLSETFLPGSGVGIPQL